MYLNSVYKICCSTETKTIQKRGTNSFVLLTHRYNLTETLKDKLVLSPNIQHSHFHIKQIYRAIYLFNFIIINNFTYELKKGKKKKIK